MRTIRATPFISAQPANGASSNLADDLRGEAESTCNEENWKATIDQKLIEWGRDPTQLDDDGTITPSKQTIQFAIALAWMWRNMGLPARRELCLMRMVALFLSSSSRAFVKCFDSPTISASNTPFLKTHVLYCVNGFHRHSSHECDSVSSLSKPSLDASPS